MKNGMWECIDSRRCATTESSQSIESPQLLFSREAAENAEKSKPKNLCALRVLGGKFSYPESKNLVGQALLPMPQRPGTAGRIETHFGQTNAVATGLPVGT
jgi:hypothetical protein